MGKKKHQKRSTPPPPTSASVENVRSSEGANAKAQQPTVLNLDESAPLPGVNDNTIMLLPNETYTAQATTMQESAPAPELLIDMDMETTAVISVPPKTHSLIDIDFSAPIPSASPAITRDRVGSDKETLASEAMTEAAGTKRTPVTGAASSPIPAASQQPTETSLQSVKKVNSDQPMPEDWNLEVELPEDQEAADSERLVETVPIAPPSQPNFPSSEHPVETHHEDEPHSFSDVVWTPEAPSETKSLRTSLNAIPEDDTVVDLPPASRFGRILSSPKYTRLTSPQQKTPTSPQKSPHPSPQKAISPAKQEPTQTKQKAPRKGRRIAPSQKDEEQGLNESEVDGDEELEEDVTSSLPALDGRITPLSATDEPREQSGSFFKRTICSRRPFLACFLLFLLSLLIARGVGKSSNSSLSAQNREDRENPIKQAADESVRRLNDGLSGRPEPVIISTVGSNGEGLKAVQMVLGALGMRIPDKIPFSGLSLGTRNKTVVKAGFKRVLGASLNPERRLQFDERSVADSAALVEWHIGRAFVAGYINATLKTIPEEQRADRWAFAHPRAGYLLPYFKSIFGAENFVFVHIVSNGMTLASKVYEEFRHMCEYLRYSDFCKNTPENKLAFWAQVTKDAFQWSKTRLDVDRYVAIREEDFTQGNKNCIGRVAKALGLKFTPEELEAAAAIGLKSVDQIEGGDDSTLAEIQTLVQDMAPVKKELQFWGYDPADPSKMTDCEHMSWV